MSARAVKQFRSLLALPVLACAADVLLTLLGQPAAYWNGDRSAVIEFNPAARLLLLVHPLLFVGAGILTSIAVAAVVFRAPRRLAAGVILLVTIGHTFAACAWLLRIGPVGWIVAIALLLLVRRALPDSLWSTVSGFAPTGLPVKNSCSSDTL